MKIFLLAIFCLVSLGCAGTYERTVNIPPDAGTQYLGGVESRATANYRGTFNLLGKAKLALADSVIVQPDGTVIYSGRVHLHDSNMEKALSAWQNVAVAKALEQGLTARSGQDAAVEKAAIEADVAKTKAVPTVINPETQQAVYPP